jgi:putative DNA primase/helicase
MNAAAIRADSVQAEQVRWLWRDRIPRGMLTVIAGRPGVGKSLLTALIAAEVSQTEDVIFSNVEDPIAEVTLPRLQAAGARLDRVHFFTPARFPDGLDSLEVVVATHKVGLIVADPIAAHVKPKMADDQGVREALTPLSAMLARTGAAFIAAHHTNKNVSKNAHPLQAVGGASGGLSGAARAVYIVGLNPEDEDERAMACAKINVRTFPDAVTFELDELDVDGGTSGLIENVGRLVFLADNVKVPAIAVALAGTENGDKKDASKLELAAEWLTHYLLPGEKSARDVEEDALQSGLSRPTLRRAAKEIEIVRRRQGFGKGSVVFWRLPDGLLAVLSGGGK